ncbi:DUF2182 domain-containing protein [Hymenobacter gummosus]|nr:DUF2182 domain-containing protein [Hymenobacter gummosus]
MKQFRSLRSSPEAVLISLSAVTWLLLLTGPASLGLKHCHVSAAGPSAASLAMLLRMNPLSTQLLGWGLMVVAMMLPKLLVPIQVLRRQSLKRHRLVNSVLFVAGYLTTWMLAGLPILAVIIAANLLLPQSYVPAAAALIVALIWQCSPLKQHFLNRGHEHQILVAFGWRAFRGAFTYGFRHGLWCVGAGWALMLFPMLLPQGHNLAMLAMTVVMLSEHLENPRFPKWEFNPRLKLVRYLVAQWRIRFPAPGFKGA